MKRTFWNVIVLITFLGVVGVAIAQVQPGPRSGSSGGVALQSSLPGSKQTGNINLNGSIVLGANTTDTTITPGATGLIFKPPSTAGFNTNLFTVNSPASTQQVASIRYYGGDLGGLLLSCPAAGTACITANNNNPITLTAATNPVIIDTAGITRNSGDLLRISNNGVTKFTVDYSGAISASANLASTSINVGTSFSVPGSNCVFATAAGGIVSPTNVGTTWACNVGYQVQMNGVSACGGGDCPVPVCNLFPGTGPNLGKTMYEVRFCNTGSNTETAPAGTYSVHFLGP